MRGGRRHDPHDDHDGDDHGHVHVHVLCFPMRLPPDLIWIRTIQNGGQRMADLHFFVERGRREPSGRRGTTKGDMNRDARRRSEGSNEGACFDEFMPVPPENQEEMNA